MIHVKTFYAYNDLRNFSYLIYDDATGESWVVDPYEGKPLIDYIKKMHLDLKGILNTHQHFDHIRGNESLQQAFSAPISKLKGSDKFAVNDKNDILILDTPGHTMDHQVFVWRNAGRPVALFSGDTLFNAGVGNCKGGGDVDALYDSTGLLSQLPPETLLYPGHDYVKRNLEFALKCEPHNKVIQERLREVSSEEVENRRAFSLSEEKEVNPFMRLDAPEVRHNLVMHSREEDQLFKRRLFHKLRSLRDQW